MNPWRLTPEGAAVHDRERLAVIADVHLGYEWARGRTGDQVPPHSLREVLARLERLLARVRIERLVIAGDLVESPRYCRATERDLVAFGAFLRERGVAPIRLAGNHDAASDGSPATLVVDGWTIAHGHRPIPGEKTVSGHHHPVFKAAGLSARCFLVGPSAVVLPAFSENAAGLNVAGEVPPRLWRGLGLRVHVEAGDELLDFGPLDDLAARLVGTARVASL